jgi:DNA replication protein DnaC
MEQIKEIARRVLPGQQWQQPPPFRQKPAERVVLDTLEITNGNIKAAVESARGWAKRKNSGAMDASLILSGPVGTGKTHIAKAVLWSIYNSLDDGTPVAPVGRFFIADDLIQALEPGTRPGMMIPQDCPVLVIDDVGSEQSIPYVGTEQQANEIQNRYFKVIDYCYTWQVSVIITTNLTIRELAGRVGKRSWSRLQQMAPAGFMVDLTGVPDYRRRESGR